MSDKSGEKNKPAKQRPKVKPSGPVAGLNVSKRSGDLGDSMRESGVDKYRKTKKKK